MKFLLLVALTLGTSFAHSAQNVVCGYWSGPALGKPKARTVFNLEGESVTYESILLNPRLSLELSKGKEGFTVGLSGPNGYSKSHITKSLLTSHSLEHQPYVATTSLDLSDNVQNSAVCYYTGDGEVAPFDH